MTVPQNTCGDGDSQLAKVSRRLESSFVRFAPREIPDSCLAQVIELARLSPSEWNFQPWRWIVVRSDAGRRQLESSTHTQAPLSSAPVVLICLADTLAWKSAPQRLQEMVASRKMTDEEAREVLHKIREYYSLSPRIAERAALASAFMALHQTLLAAAECNLSSYWITEFDEQRVKTYFHIPDAFLVAALLALGYQEGASTAPVSTLRLPSLVYKEKFGEAFNQHKSEST